MDSRRLNGSWCLLREETWGEHYCIAGELHLVNDAANDPNQRMTPWEAAIFGDFMLRVAIRSVSESGTYGVMFRGTGSGVNSLEARPTGELQLRIPGRRNYADIPAVSSLKLWSLP